MTTIILAVIVAVAFYLFDKRFAKKVKACINAIDEAKTVSKNSRREIKKRIQELSEEAAHRRDLIYQDLTSLLDKVENANENVRVVQELVRTRVEEIEFELFKLNNPIEGKCYFIDDEGERFRVTKRPNAVNVYKEGEQTIEVNLESFYADWFRGEITIDDK